MIPAESAMNAPENRREGSHPSRYGSTALLAVVLGTFACGDSSSSGDDAGEHDGGASPDAYVSSPTPPAPPAEAVPPDFSSCPSGWRSVTSTSGLTSCDPWPEGGPHACANDEAHFPGKPACERIGTPCPTGDFPEGLPSGVAVLYVRASTVSGDGSLARPYATIGEAMARAVSGSVIALAKGTYDEQVALKTGVTLWGACVHDTLLKTSAINDSEGIIMPAGNHATVKNLRVGESPRIGIYAKRSGLRRTLTLDDVVVERAARAGIAVLGETVVAQRVVIRDTRPGTNGLFGHGLDVSGAGIAQVSEIVIEQNRSNAVIASGANSRVELEDAVLRDTLPEQASLTKGRGIEAGEGARIEGRRVLLSRHKEVAVIAQGAGTSIFLEDAVIEDTANAPVRLIANGVGAAAQLGAVVELQRTILDGNGETALNSREAGSMLRLTDVIVRNTTSQTDDGNLGRGLHATSGGAVEARRTAWEQNHEIALFFAEDGTTGHLEDLTIIDTRPPGPSKAGGSGLQVASGASVEVYRARIERNHDSGVLVFDPGARLVIEDAIIRDTNAAPGIDAGGLALAALFGATLEARRVLAERSQDSALFVHGTGTTARLEDIDVQTVDARPLDGLFGRALEVAAGASAEILRARLNRSREVGIYAAGIGTVLHAQDVFLEEVSPRACAETTCVNTPSGHGVAVVLDASVDLEQFVIDRTSLCGVLISRNGSVDLRDGIVSRNPIGACIQVPGYDLDRLDDAVVYRDNGRHLDSTDHDVPDPSDASRWISDGM